MPRTHRAQLGNAVVWYSCSGKHAASEPHACPAEAASDTRVALHRGFALQIIAREVVNSNKAVSRLHVQKAHMMEMELALKHQLGASLSATRARCCITGLTVVMHRHLAGLPARWAQHAKRRATAVASRNTARIVQRW